MLSNKNILFIGPVFHNYHTLIIDKLTEFGANVSFFAERSYRVDFKLVNNFFHSKLPVYQKKHYDGILDKTQSQAFDYLFVIRGYMLPEEFVQEFRRRNPRGRLIMYQWDSNKTNPFTGLIKCFNTVYSFDFEDCKNNPGLNYLPLFFSEDILSLAQEKRDKLYDFFFMGWYLPERYEAVIRFREFCSQNNFSLKVYLYMPFTSYLKERLRGIKPDRSIVSLKHMKRENYLELLGQSSVVVDVSSPNQTGLAMRIIEALAANAKILTNNHHIKEDPTVYNPECVAFLDEKNPVIDAAFLSKKCAGAKQRLLSLGDWLKTIFYEPDVQ
jgi:hypothetical protein